MTKTVSEVFCAYCEAHTKAWQAAIKGRLDKEAELGIARLKTLLWLCDTPLELSDEQTTVFKKYKQPVPKSD